MYFNVPGTDFCVGNSIMHEGLGYLSASEKLLQENTFPVPLPAFMQFYNMLIKQKSNAFVDNAGVPISPETVEQTRQYFSKGFTIWLNGGFRQASKTLRMHIETIKGGKRMQFDKDLGSYVQLVSETSWDNLNKRGLPTETVKPISRGFGFFFIPPKEGKAICFSYLPPTSHRESATMLHCNTEPMAMNVGILPCIYKT